MLSSVFPCFRDSVLSSVYIELHTSSAFSFLRARRCPKRSSIARRRSAIRRSRCSIATASTARRVFTRRRTPPASAPIIGAELTIEAGQQASRPPSPTVGPSPRRFRLPVLCASQEGWRNLCRLLTRMKLRAPKGEGALTLDDLDGFTHRPDRAARPAAAARRPLRRRRPARSPRRRRSAAATSTSSCSGTCAAIRKTTTTRSSAWPRRSACRSSPPAACGFATPDERPLFDVLTSIREHTTLDARRPPAGAPTPSAI